MRILFLPGSYDSPAARFRLWQFVEPLRASGHHVDVRVTRPPRQWGSGLRSPQLARAHGLFASGGRIAHAMWMLRDASQFDVIMMNRDIVPNPRVSFLEPWLARRNPRLIFDFDDAIHLGSREAKLREILPRMAWLTPGNAYLAEFARPLNANVSIWPTVVDTDQYYVAPSRAPGPVRIGWSGSSYSFQLAGPLLHDIVTRLGKSGEDFEFIVISNQPPEIDLPGVRWRYIRWTAETEIEGLQQIDIGLMPLKDEPFERGKCGLKAIQYMSVGIPALVSPVGVNAEIVQDGVSGFHCRTGYDWQKRAGELLHDPDRRTQIGQAARLRAEEHYSVKALLPRMIETFERVRVGVS
jgi:glycosyltransferase involved in cell wall biosynthesis